MVTHVRRLRMLIGRYCCLAAVICGVDCTPTADSDDLGAVESIDPNNPPVNTGQWYHPALTDRWQWQLQPNAAGAINTSYEVEVYDVDLFNVSDAVISDLHARGKRVVCYFSAGSYETFRNDAGEFQASDLGNTLGDYPDERWLDIRSENVHRIMLARLDLAASRTCDAVEPDNVDGYVNHSGFPLTAADQLAFNRLIANQAHTRGLGVGLKNDLDQVPQLVNYFDFSINEQCHEFNECGALQPFLDAEKSVFNAEYASSFVNSGFNRDQLCSDARDQNIRTLVLPIDLNDSFRFSCDP